MSKRCSVCGKPVVEQYKPFCSKRCADVDLGNWLGERYIIPETREQSPSSFVNTAGDKEHRKEN